MSTSKHTLRIATRQSRLALWQAEHVAALLRAKHPGLPVELVPMTTQGDRILDRPLANIGGKGLFIKELELAMSEHRADIAVHSMKDVPSEMPPGFTLAAMLPRADPRDAFVSSLYPNFASLPQGARVGTSSLRRQCQLAHARPDLQLLTLRGNVDTRLRKLEGGELDAVVLAAAGLARLGLDVAAEHLAEDAFLPAPGQGALAIETRADDARVRELVHVLHDPASAAACDAERAFLRELGASCQVPVAAFARVADDGALTLTGLVASLDGTTVLRDVARGRAEQASDVGRALADALVARGARAIIAAAEEAAGRL